MVRTLLVASTLVLFSLSCKKETRYEAVALDLRISEVVNDSTIRFQWKALPDKDVKAYRLLRSGRHISWWQSAYRTDTIPILHYHEGLRIQESVPLGNKFTYQLEVETKSGLFRSNEVIHERKQGSFYGLVQDVVVDTVRKYAYVIGHWTGTIAQYKYQENLRVKELTIPGNIGYCSIADVNGQPELYVPRHDGWVDIYHGVSLELEDRLYVGGQKVTSVIYHNNLLFVSTSDSALVGGSQLPTKVFRRDTKALVERVSGYINTRFLLIPGSGQRTELVGVVNDYPNRAFVRNSFDQTGKLLPERSKYISAGNAQVDIFQVAPNGKHFVSGGNGMVYDTSLIYRYNLYVNRPNQLPRSHKDMVFNQSGSVVYCSREYQTTIETYDFGSGAQTGVLTTSLYPAKLFTDGKQLYSILSDQTGRTSETIHSNYYIQKINF
ncbi:hypothetical protein [Paraflavitalea pollutisoli]|uniref:hypothetical protein n=1 Tax=Paraflavitalea pollutisoli TaxID=3034143 RepID=UPI0023EB18DC|nr:hypothetical protein [Paraflavitalea sp. H1-2-19X]